jgi:pimeloyl-ACP methyl ester carboxylesterase
MELFAAQVLALLDHLDVQQAVIGGTSLGANVALATAIEGPERTRGLFVEMPVLERGAMAAGAIFVPATLTYRRLRRPARSLAKMFNRVPRTWRERGPGLYADVVLDVLGQQPAASDAVLQGLLTGELAPHPSRRESITLPTLIVGHEHDPLHPFSDAEELHREISSSRLVQARSFFELRFPPNRLSEAIADFLDELWKDPVASGEA